MAAHTKTLNELISELTLLAKLNQEAESFLEQLEEEFPYFITSTFSAVASEALQQQLDSKISTFLEQQKATLAKQADHLIAQFIFLAETDEKAKFFLEQFERQFTCPISLDFPPVEPVQIKTKRKEKKDDRYIEYEYTEPEFYSRLELERSSISPTTRQPIVETIAAPVTFLQQQITAISSFLDKNAASQQSASSSQPEKQEKESHSHSSSSQPNLPYSPKPSSPAQSDEEDEEDDELVVDLSRQKFTEHALTIQQTNTIARWDDQTNVIIIRAEPFYPRQTRTEQALMIQQAHLGDATAQYLLSQIYENGGGHDIPINHKLSLKWLKKAADGGHREAWLQLGNRVLYQAQIGDKKAQYLMGQIYQNGDYGITIDHERSLKWLKSAAERGHVEAQFQVGNRLRHINPARAIFYYEVAAGNGHPEARQNLKRLLKNDKQDSADPTILSQQLDSKISSVSSVLRQREEGQNQSYSSSSDWDASLSHNSQPNNSSSSSNSRSRSNSSSQPSSFRHNTNSSSSGSNSENSDSAENFDGILSEELEHKIRSLDFLIEYTGAHDAYMNLDGRNSSRTALLSPSSFFNHNVGSSASGPSSRSPVNTYKSEEDKKQAETQYKLAMTNDDPHNPLLADTWYKEAADKGHVEAQYIMGRRYEDKNKLALAHSYYQRAADNGHNSAREALTHLITTLQTKLNSYANQKYATNQAALWSPSDDDVARVNLARILSRKLSGEERDRLFTKKEAELIFSSDRLNVIFNEHPWLIAKVHEWTQVPLVQNNVPSPVARRGMGNS